MTSLEMNSSLAVTDHVISISVMDVRQTFKSLFKQPDPDRLISSLLSIGCVGLTPYELCELETERRAEELTRVDHQV